MFAHISHRLERDADSIRCQTSSTLLQALDEQIAHVRQTHQTETTSRQAYNHARDAAYLKESKGNKKGKGNYDPTPPGYPHDPLTTTGRL